MSVFILGYFFIIIIIYECYNKVMLEIGLFFYLFILYEE